MSGTMGPLDIGAERVSGIAWNPLPVPPATFAERFSLGWADAEQTQGTGVAARNLYNAYERQREVLRGAGYANAPNPVAYDATALGGLVRSTYARDIAIRDYRAIVEQARRQHPDRAAEFLMPEEIQADADRRALEARAARETQDRVGGGALGGLAADALSAVRDPTNVLTLPLGAGRIAGGVALRILGTALAEGAIGAGAQVVSDLGPEGAAWERRRLGLDMDVGGNALGGFLGGAVIGGGARGLLEGWRAFRGTVPAPDGGVALREGDAARNLEVRLREQEGRPAGEEVQALHERAADAQADAVAQGRIAPVPASLSAAAVPAPRVPLRQADPADLAGDLGRFLDEVVAAPGGQSSRMQLGTFEPNVIARVQADTGVDLTGLQHSIQSDELRHTWRRHGPGGAAGDATPLTREDIQRIGEYIATADRVILDGTTHQGLPTLRFEKDLPDRSVAVIEEVRTRRHILSFKSMYRYGKRGPGTAGSPPGPGPGSPPPLRPQRGPGTAAPQIAPDLTRFNAYTAAGRAVAVEPQVAELRDLIPSHLDDGRPNPAYPHAEGVQPRDRSRDASLAQVRDIAAKLEPERLGASPEAGTGAPIVAADNVVESGNGRVLALRQAMADPALAGRRDAYRAWLEAQGFDLAGYENPVLVARRVSALTPEERRAFVREANAETSLTMSAAEQARADAELAGRALDLYRGGDVTAADNAAFVRAFVQGLPQTAQGRLLKADGTLSAEGARRLRAAILARAYGDEMGPLLERILDGDAEGLRSIAGAIQDVAPGWAGLRAAAARGEIAPGMDLTADLFQAIRTVSLAREKRIPVGDMLAQGDLDIPPMGDNARAILASMYREPGFKGAAGRDTVARRLDAYVAEAMKTRPEPDLFGAPPAAAGDVLAATDPMRGRQKALAEAGTRIAEAQAEPKVPDAEFAEAQRIAAARDMQVPDPVTGEMRGLRELLDAAEEAEADALAAAACFLGGGAAGMG
ncbi:hypothetical protein M0638_22240 [Roseomonas sp. NAR14]|uniref:DdrB-like domain-containing protein n=1 Tax=Roseomonas acroporae TaxID=2937791 RepID=A0A9X1YAD9_9PROT|nr:hypothetical protein [Roseomonas acroporae]MCK8787099.1 hypothetical protein [Roseomonas acroporae]